MAAEEGEPLKPPDATAALGGDRQEEALEDQAARLPVDVLADSLCRVPPRSLAVSRCISRAWCDTVDGRRLLRADLLPLSLAGLFVHFDEHKFPEFLARPSSTAAGARTVSGDLSFLPSASPHCGYIWEEGCVDFYDYKIKDHCNGLLLLHNNCVVNPATRWWNTLPTCPAKRGAANLKYVAGLVYDPMVSPYYQVFMIPRLDSYQLGEKEDPSMEESEWPPSTYKMYVFSSKSGCWEEKDFVREGDAAGTVGKIRAVSYTEYSAAYFRGALYIHCEYDFVMRISLPNYTYNVIKPPTDLKVDDYPQITVARSEKGIYFVELVAYSCEDNWWLRVWILNESCGQIEWTLKHEKDLRNMPPHQWFCRRVKWILEDINYSLFRASSFPEDNKKETIEEKFEWNSEEDVQDKDMVDDGYLEDKKALFDDIMILGLHPYKEIVFLSASERTCLAYHLNGSKIEELGNIYPKEYIYFKMLGNEREKIKSFPYTPCWMEEFPGNN